MLSALDGTSQIQMTKVKKKRRPVLTSCFPLPSTHEGTNFDRFESEKFQSRVALIQRG